MSNLALGDAGPDSPVLVDGWTSSRSSARVGSVGATRSRMVQTGLVALALMAAGCGAPTIDGPSPPRTDAGTPVPGDNDAGEDPTPTPVDTPSCGESTLEAQQLFDNACSRCHGQMGSGGLANIDDVAALIESGRVVPGDAAASPIYRRIAGGTMPPAGVTPRPTDTQVVAVETWINCGAPAFPSTPTPTPAEARSIDSVMDEISDDLRRFDNRAQRQSLRYIILTHRANAGATPGELSQLRDAVDVLVNNLSQGSRVVSPVAVDRDRTILRIDIEDYGWDANTWNQLVAGYPYFVQYDDTSVEFPFDESTEEFIQQETGEEIPFIYADWFIANASQPPLYYDILDLPNTLDGLYAQLGVDFDGDLASLDFVRSGFAVSGVSVSNRIMQRNTAPGGGYVWSSFDFANGGGNGNIFNNPTDFQEDGGEVIFRLNNGLQGYFVNNAAGARLDVAPVQVVSDPSSPTREVIPGMSCMGCHDASGTIPRSDELRAHVIATQPSGDIRNQVLNTHPSNDILSEIFERDQESYQAARRLVGRDGRERPVPDAAVTYLEVDRSLRDLAAALWLDPDRVRDAVLTDINLGTAFRAVATSAGGRVNREEVEAEFADLVCSIGVGRPVCSALTQSASCGCVDPR